MSLPHHVGLRPPVGVLVPNANHQSLFISRSSSPITTDNNQSSAHFVFAINSIRIKFISFPSPIFKTHFKSSSPGFKAEALKSSPNPRSGRPLASVSILLHRTELLRSDPGLPISKPPTAFSPPAIPSVRPQVAKLGMIESAG